MSWEDEIDHAEHAYWRENMNDEDDHATTTTATLREGIEPYDTNTDLESEDAGYCVLCEEGVEYEGPHAHEYFVSRDGASSRTADDLCNVFLIDVSELTTYVIPEWVATIEWDREGSAGWCVDPDDSQALNDEANYGAESALSDAGLFVVWDDGYSIQRVVELNQ